MDNRKVKVLQVRDTANVHRLASALPHLLKILALLAQTVHVIQILLYGITNSTIHLKHYGAATVKSKVRAVAVTGVKRFPAILYKLDEKLNLR